MLKVFISYTNTDRHWAEWIAWQIETAGYDVRFQPWDFVAGSNVVRELEAAVEWADVTVMVLSEAYLESKLCRAEWYKGLLDDPVGEDRKLLPLRIEPCQPQGLLRAVIHTDLVGLREEEARGRILKALERGRQKPAQAPNFPGTGLQQMKRLEKPPASQPRFPASTPPAPGSSDQAVDPSTSSDALVGAYDVFLSYASGDAPSVEALANHLKAQGLNPFFDKWHLVPGEPRQEALEKALEGSQSCAVFVGPSGIGGWQNEEMRDAIAERVRDRRYRVIPVLLPQAVEPEGRGLPRFLRRTTWVDFRAGLEDAEAFERLVWGIRGVRDTTPSIRETPSLIRETPSLIRPDELLPPETPEEPPNDSEQPMSPGTPENPSFLEQESKPPDDSNTSKGLWTKLSLGIAIAIVTFLAVWWNGQQSRDKNPPIADLTPAVLRITAEADGLPRTGTGFVVAIDREVIFIATAKHVVQGASKVGVEFPLEASGAFEAEAFWNDAALDLSLIRVHAPEVKTQALRISDRPIAPGVAATVIGYPRRATSPRISTATVTGLEGSGLLISGLLTTGNSGSPVFAEGLVIGMLFKSAGEFQTAIPGSSLKLTLENRLPALSNQFQE